MGPAAAAAEEDEKGLKKDFLAPWSDFLVLPAPVDSSVRVSSRRGSLLLIGWVRLMFETQVGSWLLA